MKQFSVTLQYYSPKAYDYVRTKFENLLPHPRTLRRWYMVVDGMPGFTEESFRTIKCEASKSPVYCNIVVDESIKQYLEEDTAKNVYGYINMGANYSYERDDPLLAKSVLMFIAVSLNGYWKLPLASFLIDSLNGQERANLLNKTIELLIDTGAHVNSITFDGAKVNTKMCTELGANFDLLDNRPYLEIPNNEKLYIFYDPAHMLKLIRNAWEKIIL